MAQVGIVERKVIRESGDQEVDIRVSGHQEFKQRTEGRGQRAEGRGRRTNDAIDEGGETIDDGGRTTKIGGRLLELQRITGFSAGVEAGEKCTADL